MYWQKSKQELDGPLPCCTADLVSRTGVEVILLSSVTAGVLRPRNYKERALCQSAGVFLQPNWSRNDCILQARNNTCLSRMANERLLE